MREWASVRNWQPDNRDPQQEEVVPAAQPNAAAEVDLAAGDYLASVETRSATPPSAGEVEGSATAELEAMFNEFEHVPSSTTTTGGAVVDGDVGGDGEQGHNAGGRHDDWRVAESFLFDEGQPVFNAFSHTRRIYEIFQLLRCGMWPDEILTGLPNPNPNPQQGAEGGGDGAGGGGTGGGGGGNPRVVVL